MALIETPRNLGIEAPLECDSCGKVIGSEDEAGWANGPDAYWCRECLLESNIDGLYAAAIPYNKWPKDELEYFRERYMD